MPREKKELFSPVHTSVIVLALGVVAYVLYQPPLESVRPGAADVKALESGEQRVQARLWQDPFMAVTDHKKGDKDDDVKLMVELQAGKSLRIDVAKDRPADHHQISSLAKILNKEGQSLVMMVMTDGSASAEGHEQRLRDRNAVLSALGVACFVPSDPEHIEYFTWPPPPFSSGNNPWDKGNQNYLKFVPYEELKYDTLGVCGGRGETFKRVVVLWYQEDELGDHPLKTLSGVWAHLIQTIITITEKGRVSPKTNRTVLPSLVILGPRSSSGLQTIVEGILDNSKNESTVPLFERIPEVNLWSPWATVDDDLLVYSLHNLIKEKNKCLQDGKSDYPDKSGECVRSIFKEENVKFFRTIPSDRMLVGALVQELRKRNTIGEQLNKRKIAIVSEWDTFYGRSLPRELEMCAQRKTEEHECKTSKDALKLFVERPERDNGSGVFWYSYLRGLDGKVPGRDRRQTRRKGSKDEEAPTLKESIRSIELSEMERPVEESQLDYIRRLAKVIREKDEEEKDKCKIWERFIHQCGGIEARGIEAIGVTGTDVYDKFLVLQALRQSLPDKVFFTTDLDARYWDPELIKWTRNLIVASHFGLGLEENIQRNIPPFRESYQTSAFYAVLRAMKFLQCSDGEKIPCSPSGLKSSLEKTQVYESEIPVRLYEIGSKGPVALGLYYPEPTDDGEKYLRKPTPDG